MPDRNDGKRWSTRDKRDLAEALARGDSIEEAAKLLLRAGTIGEVARVAAELGLLADSGKYAAGKYTVVLFRDSGEGAGVEMELARESRLDVAGALYELMCAQYPGRLIMLCNKAQVLRRSDRT